MVNLQGFDKTKAAAQPASVTQTERITPWHPALASPWQTNTVCPVQLHPLCAASLKSSESLTYDFSNTWRYSKGLGTLLLCASVCERLTFSRKKKITGKKKKTEDETLKSLEAFTKSKVIRRRGKDPKKVTNGLYFYGTPLSGDLKTQCILQLGKTKYYKVDYNLTDKTPITKGEKSNTKNK